MNKKCEFKKSVLSVTLSRLIGLAVFIILIGVLNLIDVKNIIFLKVVWFLTSSLGLIIAYSLFFYLGELFHLFKIPFNLVGVFFNACGAVILLKFLILLFNFLNISLGFLLGFYGLNNLTVIYSIISVSLFIIVIIIGILNIVSKNFGKKEKKKNSKKKNVKCFELIDWKAVRKEIEMARRSLVRFVKKVLDKK